MNAHKPEPPLVKICGIREREHAITAVESGADLIGLVFYPPSPRYVTPGEARAVVETVRSLPRGDEVRIVGLFVNEPAETINQVADEVGLDIIQLSGDETPDVIGKIGRPAIASIRVDSSGRSEEERRFAAFAGATPAPLAVHVDSHVHGMYGGTGTVADWFVAADFARRYPTILAGGLRPETVAEAIHRVKPYAVDVSSGVETDGRKDHNKIRAFVENAKGSRVAGASR